MRRLQTHLAIVLLALAALLALGTSAWAEEGLSAKLDSSGLIHVRRGEVELAQIDLNAHGPQWKHAPQSDATGQVDDLPDQAGKRCVGTLPVPDTEGALRFTETVKTITNGLRLEYDVVMTQTMKINGLQLSFGLPVTQYGGKELQVAQPDGEPWGVPLPQEQPKTNYQLWSGEGARFEVAKGTEGAITIQLRAAADAMVQDLRQWQQSVFEVRFPAITEDGGREVTADDRFHLDLTVTFAGPVQLLGP